MHCFSDVFVGVAIAVATASYFDLKGHSAVTYGKIQNVFHCIIVKLLVIMKIMFLFC